MASSSAPSVGRFWIGQRLANGNTPRLEPNTQTYTYVASAINIAITILEHPKSLEVLAAAAYKTDLWFATGGGILHRHSGRARNTQEVKIELRNGYFPNVLIDETITEPNLLGLHMRNHYHRQFQVDQFPFREQNIHLNAPMVQQMVASAGSRAGGQEFRNWLFKVATCLAHEATHVLITCLTGGGGPSGGTPPPVADPAGAYRPNPTKGESGRFLEWAALGGNIHWDYNDREDRRSTGVPYLVQTGTTLPSAWKIDENTINNVVTYNITLPFPGRVFTPWRTNTTPENTQPRPTAVNPNMFQGAIVVMDDLKEVLDVVKKNKKAQLKEFKSKRTGNTYWGFNEIKAKS
ncbi:hypothetical protein M011DRAFT_524785 [Sporormia fimetaria CBS 119925]|uniref:Uncharacterized protein n=1 Tax=Sporormia fimetaria CBS 119925 TaxID=1340428 RepID=A0A6A6VI07_9PLEO|nr:hypothetical protein M011DRAFT_524785 [Sporormia fimetaria CBS 119925]